ncbi:MAG TPA: acyltransferase [Bryobacteraceae bacterium]|nr:acyltransferase [Bryobacteraceae bacterium]
MTPSSSPPPRFFPGLESLRGIAALTVALYHVSWQSHFVHWSFVRNGALMVDFFFVLSGFVLFHSYGGKLESLSSSLRFMIVRFGRLYPLHLASLLAFVAIECAKWGVVRFHLAAIASVPFAQNTPGTLISNLLLIHGLGINNQPTWNTPSWSISVEFYIYALFALVVVLFRKKPLLLASSGALAIVGLIVSWKAAGGLDSTVQYGFFRGLLGFFCGVITWHCYAGLRGRFGGRTLACIAIALGISAVAFLCWMRRGLEDFFAIPLFVSIVLTIALLDSRGSSLLDWRGFVWLGTISYSVYMVHPVVIWCFEFVLQYVLKLPRPDYYAMNIWTGDAVVLLYVGVVLAVSGWTYRHIEDRFRQKIRRIWMGRALSQW